MLVADDHPVVREALAAWINRQPDVMVVAEASNGCEALSLWMQHRPDVGLIELGLPHLDGISCLAEIRTCHAVARFVVLTTFDDDEDIFRAMRAGARAYLLKNASREELLECLRRVRAGQTFVPPEIAAKLAARVAAPELTRRENSGELCMLPPLLGERAGVRASVSFNLILGVGGSDYPTFPSARVSLVTSAATKEGSLNGLLVSGQWFPSY